MKNLFSEYVKEYGFEADGRKHYRYEPYGSIDGFEDCDVVEKENAYLLYDRGQWHSSQMTVIIPRVWDWPVKIRTGSGDTYQETYLACPFGIKNTPFGVSAPEFIENTGLKELAVDWSPQYTGESGVEFGDFWYSKEGTPCFKVKSPLKAKHVWIRALAWKEGGKIMPSKKFAKAVGSPYCRIVYMNGVYNAFVNIVLPIDTDILVKEDGGFEVRKRDQEQLLGVLKSIHEEYWEDAPYPLVKEVEEKNLLSAFSVLRYRPLLEKIQKREHDAWAAYYEEVGYDPENEFTGEIREFYDSYFTWVTADATLYARNARYSAEDVRKQVEALDKEMTLIRNLTWYYREHGVAFRADLSRILRYGKFIWKPGDTGTGYAGEWLFSDDETYETQKKRFDRETAWSILDEPFHPFFS